MSPSYTDKNKSFSQLCFQSQDKKGVRIGNAIPLPPDYKKGAGGYITGFWKHLFLTLFKAASQEQHVAVGALSAARGTVSL